MSSRPSQLCMYVIFNVVKVDLAQLDCVCDAGLQIHEPGGDVYDVKSLNIKR